MLPSSTFFVMLRKSANILMFKDKLSHADSSLLSSGVSHTHWHQWCFQTLFDSLSFWWEGKSVLGGGGQKSWWWSALGRGAASQQGDPKANGTGGCKHKHQESGEDTAALCACAAGEALAASAPSPLLLAVLQAFTSLICCTESSHSRAQCWCRPRGRHTAELSQGAGAPDLPLTCLRKVTL